MAMIEPLLSWVFLAVVAFSAVLIVIVAVTTAANVLKIRRLRKCAEAATPDKLMLLYRAIGEIGTLPANCVMFCYLGTIARSPQATFHIPQELEDHPWSGCSVTLAIDKTADEPSLCWSVETTPNSEASGSALAGGFHLTALHVPRLEFNSGRQQNRYTSNFYLSNSSSVLQIVNELCPENPSDFLDFLLQPSGGLGDETDQIRVGGSPSWVRRPKWSRCSKCRKPMTLLVQIPSSCFKGTKFLATVYVFGCAAHPEEFHQVWQF